MTTQSITTTSTSAPSFLSGTSLCNKVELQDIFKVGIETKLDEIALITNSSPLTWCDLDTPSSNISQGLLRLRAKTGNKIASLMPNCAELIVHYVTGMKVDLVMTPLNYCYSPPEMDYTLSNVEWVHHPISTCRRV